MNKNIKTLVIFLCLNMLFLSHSQSHELNRLVVSCHPQVSVVASSKGFKRTEWSSPESQYMIPTKERFADRRLQRLTADEIKQLTSSDEHGGKYLNGKLVEQEFPFLTFDLDSIDISEKFDETLAFSNIYAPNDQLEKGNYIKLRGYRSWIGDEKNIILHIQAIVYRNGLPSMGSSISISPQDTESVSSLVQHPLQLELEYALRSLYFTAIEKGPALIPKINALSDSYYSQMGEGSVSSLLLSCRISR